MSFIWGGSLQVLILSLRHHCDDEVIVSSLRFQTVLSLELQEGCTSLSTYEASFLAFFGLGSHHHNNSYSVLNATCTSGKLQWILMLGSVCHRLLHCWICTSKRVTECSNYIHMCKHTYPYLCDTGIHTHIHINLYIYIILIHNS